MHSRILEALTAALDELAARRLVVGFSGGRDSSVLLHALVKLQASSALAALHVNHGLHRDADDWQRHCESICRAWGVPLKVVRLGLVSGPNAEQRARKARYAAFSEHTCTGDCLLLAHHRDDQVETMLLRLMRGGATVGMAAMPRRRAIGRGELARPLLELPGTELQRYARDCELSWVDDPSNESEQFDRNYVRHRILPLLEQRWPGYRQVMARTAALMGDAARLMREISDEDMCTRLGVDGSLAIGDLHNLSELRQLNLLHGWLTSHEVLTPSRNRLRELVRQSKSGVDAQPCVLFGEVEIRRFRDALHVVRPHVGGTDEQMRWRPPERARWCGGTLWAQPVVGHGLLRDAVSELEVRARRGGERVSPSGRVTRPLKKLLQEAHVPPWLRFRLPLAHVGEALVVVPGVLVSEGWQ
ncbi:MAG: tRNA lysidine(34) synthetase TilS, partial [Pseudomonadales bacterium]